MKPAMVSPEYFVHPIYQNRHWAIIEQITPKKSLPGIPAGFPEIRGQMAMVL
jgi:hypothetical protein